MKKNMLVIFGLLVSLVSAGAVSAKSISQNKNVAAVRSTAKVTQEQARKNALKKVPGAIEDEYTIEDEDENVTTYVFIIKDKKGKNFEVQIDANDGKVLSSEEQTEEIDDPENLPAVVETDKSQNSDEDSDEDSEPPMMDEVQMPMEVIETPVTDEVVSSEEPPLNFNRHLFN